MSTVFEIVETFNYLSRNEQQKNELKAAIMPYLVWPLGHHDWKIRRYTCKIYLLNETDAELRDLFTQEHVVQNFLFLLRHDCTEVKLLILELFEAFFCSLSISELRQFHSQYEVFDVYFDLLPHQETRISLRILRRLFICLSVERRVGEQEQESLKMHFVQKGLLEVLRKLWMQGDEELDHLVRRGVGRFFPTLEKDFF